MLSLFIWVAFSGIFNYSSNPATIYTRWLLLALLLAVVSKTLSCAELMVITCSFLRASPSVPSAETWSIFEMKQGKRHAPHRTCPTNSPAQTSSSPPGRRPPLPRSEASALSASMPAEVCRSGGAPRRHRLEVSLRSTAKRFSPSAARSVAARIALDFSLH